jgi:hypothetical protein
MEKIYSKNKGYNFTGLKRKKTLFHFLSHENLQRLNGLNHFLKKFLFGINPQSYDKELDQLELRMLERIDSPFERFFVQINNSEKAESLNIWTLGINRHLDNTPVVLSTFINFLFKYKFIVAKLI